MFYLNRYLFKNFVTTKDKVSSLKMQENHEENYLEEPELSAGSVRQELRRGTTKRRKLNPVE
jgi:hypothetical protein